MKQETLTQMVWRLSIENSHMKWNPLIWIAEDEYRITIGEVIE